MPKEVRLKIPEEFSGLFEDKAVERRVLRSVAKQRLKELKEEKKEAESHIFEFEKKYGSKFREFEKRVETGKVGKEEHEDYNQWYFWEKVRNRNSKLIKKVKTVV